MCYADGYVGESGVFHPGAKCLKQDRDGTAVEKQKANQGGGKAFAPDLFGTAGSYT